MFKISPDFVLLLLNLLNYVNCDDLENNRYQWIKYLTYDVGSCSEYLQYQLIGDFINGKLTVPHMEIGDTIMLTFLETFPKDTYSHGILLPEGSSQEVINRLQKKEPILFRVDFPIMDRNRRPKLSNIFINNNKLCSTRMESSNNNIRVRTLEHTLNIINGSMQVYTHNIHMPHFAKAPNESCGLVEREVSIYGFTPRVFGGQLIIRGEYPWLTAIYRKRSGGINFICAGSLITSKIILSTAHVFESLTAENITTMLGRHNLTNFMEDGYIIRDIESVVLHPDYKSGTGFSDADLALLVMKEHVSFTKFIKPICLWGEPADELRISNQTAVVVGWGSDEDGNSVSIVPKKVNVQIVSAEVCLRSSIAFNVFTSSRTLCAGKRDGSGPCRGDSGGPLMLNRNGTWMVRGVVSLGLTAQGRCDLLEYTVYCDVAKHMSWLQNQIKQQEPAVTGALKDICGISKTESRIEHPWLAAVYRKLLTGELFACTGTIVSSRSVLIPAICYEDAEVLQVRKIRVYLGRYDLSDINEEGVLSREVETVFLYHLDQESSDRLGHDGALLQLKDAVGFTQYVKPICLWSEPRDQIQITGQPVTLSGWLDYEVHKEIWTVPKSMEVNIVPLEQCQLLGHNVSTTSNILCIPRDGILNGRIPMMHRNGRWLLLGGCKYIHESDSFCAIGYDDIAEKMSWIQTNMLS